MEYTDIKLTQIDLIRDLWEKNRAYHEVHSEYFASTYQGICFENRMGKYRNHKEDMCKITLCMECGNVVGYCISAITDATGEIESLHVDASKRRNGIGERLVEIHREWMREMKCEKIGVTVSQENAPTIEFYKKLGFYPNTLYMQQL